MASALSMNRSTHFRTPTVQAKDPRLVAVRHIAYLRATWDGEVEPLITRHRHNPAGHLVEQCDPRLFDITSCPNLSRIYNFAGEALKIDSVDAGWRLTLPGLAGEPLQRWDERGSHWRTRFDEQLHIVAVEENAEADVDVFTYADASADAGHNQRGQLLEQQDRSGSLRADSFALTGQPRQETRTFHDDAAFTRHQVFSPLGALLEQTDAGGHRQQSRYGLAGQLKHTQLLINGKTDWQPVILDAQYNAAEQITEQLAGNKVLSQWSYDPADGRLHTQSSRKSGGDVLQDFEYFYDRVGNITRIEDHVFQPRYFANQFIDGHRDFIYDSLSRVTSATGYDDAPPSDIPGLPQPGDPNNRLNYTRTYKYDRGGNLIELRHVRAGNNCTRQMRIDPNSNRGVRWKPGDAEPVFDDLFDRHGNQQAVQPGQPITWNARNEVQKVTLIARANERSDAEHYDYSQGTRVLKHYETFTASTEHFQQVRYLPGLEIRTRDNGEELHVINIGNAHCLHWVAKKPEGIDNDQLRYSLEDHLGSCVMELDQQAQVISQEGYYPFGETAWMACRNEVEVSYRFIRYSGKEMDISGLYYYGARYYAPWLQRWISADPAGDVDGLNLYGFVGNNPVLHVDQTGTSKVVFDLIKQAVGIFNSAKTATEQLHNLTTEFDGLVPEGANIEELRERMTFGEFIKSRHGIKSVFYGAGKGMVIGGFIGTAVPGIGNVIGSVAGTIAGAIVFPVLRYHFFKKGLKLAETLHTQELKDGLNTLGQTVSNLAEGAEDFIKGGKALIDSIKNFADTLEAYPDRIQTTFYSQFDSLSPELQRRVLKLMREGMDPFESITEVRKVAEDTGGNPVASAGSPVVLVLDSEGTFVPPGATGATSARRSSSYRRSRSESFTQAKNETYA
ncbi:RHS repeat-associated core domain-containing protein [Pseudomonas sp. R84]|uniref:RHS repeat-associated core domain-containing protein n=1 Tax=Pseudomonas sp. R84 TaxID=1573712 RepID=UPI001EEC14DE|nr:RHS repeat-associated core domain-containing protein [Pseudomonas sp. R84]